MRNFSKLIFAAAMVGVAFSAMAADMPANNPPAPPPPAEQILRWTGMYGGMTAGYGWTNDDYSIAANDATSRFILSRNLFPSTISMRQDGAVIGGRLGYDYQFAPSWLVGLYGDWYWSDVRANGNVAGPLMNVAYTSRIKSGFDLIGRAGWLATNRDLIYGGIGVGWINTESMVTSSGLACLILTTCPNGGISEWRSGLKLAAGWEHRFNKMISFGLEYNWADYRTQTFPVAMSFGRTGTSFTNSTTLQPQELKVVLLARF